MKRIFLAIAALFLLAAVGPVQAGVVPCGEPGNPCQLCDVFVMIDNILDFILIKMVPVIAVLMLVVGGIMFFFAGADPGMLTKAKSLITSTIIGLVIIFAAFLIVGTVLSVLGLTGWTEDLYRNWWQEGFFQIQGC